MFTDLDGRLSQSFLNSMLASPSGTTWYNTGEGFISEGRNAIDYDGNSIDWGTEYTDMLMQRVGLGTSGEGGGVAGTKILPELVLNGYGRANHWGGAISTYNINHGILYNGIAGMQSAWNRAMFDSGRQLGIAEIDRGVVRMMGGDMFGFSDIAGIGIEKISEDHPYLGMALGVIGIVALKKPQLALAEEKAVFYSVAFEMKLSTSSYPGIYRGGHFCEANKALEAVMKSDVRFASSMDELGIVIPRSPAGSILGKSPTNWVWHHHVDEGIMQLVPKSQHTVGRLFGVLCILEIGVVFQFGENKCKIIFYEFNRFS